MLEDEGVSDVSLVDMGGFIFFEDGDRRLALLSSDEGCLTVSEHSPRLLPPPVSSEWVLAKVKEVSRKTRISFTGVEEQVKALFCEIERRRCESPRQGNLQRRVRK